MNVTDVTGPAAYVAILLAAIVEGEVVFVAAAALVGRGQLDPVGVAAAGAAGAAIGDQLYFYLLRGRLRRVLDRFPAIQRVGHRLAVRVLRHDTLTILSIRFSPGIRIALAAACAYANVPPLKFSLLNALTAIVWAALLLALVAWLGPRWLATLGISGWWGVLVPAAVVVLLTRRIARAERHAAEAPGDNGA